MNTEYRIMNTFLTLAAAGCVMTSLAGCETPSTGPEAVESAPIAETGKPRTREQLELAYNCGAFDAQSCVTAMCDQANGVFDVTTFRCECPDSIRSFFLSGNQVPVCSFNASPLWDGRYELAAIQRGETGRVKTLARDSREAERFHIASVASGYFVPSRESIAARGVLPRSGSHFSFGVAQGAPSIVAYEIEQDHEGSSLSLDAEEALFKDFAEFRMPAENNFEGPAASFDRAALALLQRYSFKFSRHGDRKELGKQISYLRWQESETRGDCFETCKTSISLGTGVVAGVPYQAFHEVEFVRGARAHRRIAIYNASGLLMGFVTQNPNGSVGVVGLGRVEGDDILKDPSLPYFRYFDVNGAMIERRNVS